jgi:glycosyltransferase involved in cell wall biosynthesis
MLPVVSIITPIFNSEDTIMECYKSVCNQTFRNWEMIMVDDGSADCTPQIISTIEDPQTRILTQNNQGVSAARNRGIQHAKGKYIAFLDSDDVWKPEKLEQQLKIFEENVSNIGLVHTGYRIFETDPNESSKAYVKSLPFDDESESLRIILENFLVLSSVMIRHDVLKQIGNFDEDLFGTEDWDLFIRIRKSYCFQFLDQELTLYRYHENGISKNVTRQINQEMNVLKKHLFQKDIPLSLQKKGLSLHYQRGAHMYLLKKELFLALKLYLLSLLCYPTCFEYYCLPFIYLNRKWKLFLNFHFQKVLKKIK